MNHWKKKLGLAALSFSFLTFGSLDASDCGRWSNCYDDSCYTTTHFEFGLDFLYWKPCYDDLDFAIERVSIDPDHYRYKSLCSDWEPGVKFTVCFPEFLCDWSFRGSYVWIRSTDRHSVDSEGRVVDLLVHPQLQENVFSDFVSAKWNTSYNEWDFVAYQKVLFGGCNEFYPYIGLAGIWLNQKLTSSQEAGSHTVTTDWTSHFWSVGLRSGVEYNYHLFTGLKLYADANASILCGASNTVNTQTQIISSEENVMHFRDSKCCRIVPGFHIGLGVMYEVCFCGLDFDAKLGWEFLNWYNLPNHRTFTGDQGEDVRPVDVGTSTSPNIRTIGFNGVVAGLSVSF